MEFKKISEIKAYEENPRKIPDKAVKAVAESIKQFGFLQPIVLDADGVVLAGHTRLKAADLLRLDQVPVITADKLTPEEARAYRIADNKTGEISEWDRDFLSGEVTDLIRSGIDLTEFGFTDYEIARLLFDDSEDGKTDPDAIPEQPEPMTQPGDLYELGDHRLICGDATDPAVLARLMGEDKADLWLTDPPYGVDYDAPALQRPGLREKFRREKLTNDAGDLSFFPTVVDNVDAILKEGGVFYVWYSIVTSNHFIETLKNKFYLSIALIWDKTRITPSYGDYCHNYEPCLYGWKKGAEHYFKGETGEPALWRFNKNLKNKLHPTEKPVDLFIKSIKLSSRRGEIVLDTFAGSGTTLIAAEQTGRLARCVELSPNYCDVIVKRWMDFTGEEAVKL